MTTLYTPLLRACLRPHSDDGQDLAESILAAHYSDYVRTETYCYAAGTIPVMLVAHTDTVHDDAPILHYDRRRAVVWSPTGLGADDRAGVYAIARLLAAGHRPHVLLTDGEESGGIGARDAADDLSPDVRMLIQLDRAGARDAVYYSCDCPALERYWTRRGYPTAHGSYTDIADLMPAWGIAAANLSVGYYSQHTRWEYLRLKELERTIQTVAAVLRSPPRRQYVYAARPQPTHTRLSWLRNKSDDTSLALDIDLYRCQDCGQRYPLAALSDLGYCRDCLDCLTTPLEDPPSHAP